MIQRMVSKSPELPTVLTEPSAGGLTGPILNILLGVHGTTQECTTISMIRSAPVGGKNSIARLAVKASPERGIDTLEGQSCAQHVVCQRAGRFVNIHHPGKKCGSKEFQNQIFRDPRLGYFHSGRRDCLSEPPNTAKTPSKASTPYNPSSPSDTPSAPNTRLPSAAAAVD